MARLSTPRRIIGWAIVLVVFLLVISAGKVVTLFTDFLWFKELALTPVFMTMLYSKIGLGVGVGVGALLLIGLNLVIALRISGRAQRFPGYADQQMLELLSRLPGFSVLLMAAVALVSFFLGSWASTYWEVLLRWLNAVPFGSADPLFGRDIGFYVFALPFYRFVYYAVMAVEIFSLVAALFVYLARQNCVFDGRRIHIAPAARNHLLILIGLILLSLAVYFQFRMFSLVVAQGSLLSGAGYAQIKVELPILGVMRFVALAAGLMVWAALFRRTLGLAIGAVVLLIGGALGGSLVTQMVQKFVVAPDELAKETPYIAWSIANTRAAYGLNKIETRPFVPSGDLDAQALENNRQTIQNIRLWDKEPLLTTYGQLQEIRTYYEFLDVDNDRYTINGQYRQVMFSPRELLPSSISSRTWINEHLTYTHGYGLCLGPVTSVTPEGLPDFYVKDIPPVSSIPLKVTRPQIYFGESDAGYAIVKTGAKEFDYPSGNENVYTVYGGTGGIPMGGFLKKALFALRFGELKILLRQDIKADSRILFDRQILPRIRKAIPFLQYDSDPYMVIADDGRLVWIVDGYTTSSAYPYAAATGGMGNYIRNSAKAVIDAYDGSLDLYVSDPTDPLITTFGRVFPGLFKTLDAMPDDLRRHIRYPQTLFSIQAYVYAIYHMTDPQVFYNKEDIWRIPAAAAQNGSGMMDPYYTIMKLAGVGDKEEFILMVPLSPSKKENMIAWMAARCDPPNYGKLLVFNFPKQELVYGPTQIESRINQDPEISKQLTLWNQGGSRVIRGSLLVIPVDESLIYVQPLYLTAKTSTQNGGGVPELKRVIVAYENTIAMEPTLEASLQKIFGGSRRTDDVDAAESSAFSGDRAGERTLEQLVGEAQRQFARGQEELRRGDWAGYGEAMKEVERLIGEIRQAAGER